MKKTIIKELSLDEIKPYWKNPRETNDLAVRKVKESIKEFGYNQYITVDKDNVIVTGHTRYKALKELGFDKIKVIVLDLPPQKIRQYRIIDNKVTEYNDWNDNLEIELEEIGDDFLIQFFESDEINNLIASNVGQDIEEVKNEEIQEKQENMKNEFKKKNKIRTEERMFKLICPYCEKEFYLNKTDIIWKKIKEVVKKELE